MMPNSETDYKKLFSELIKKQMLILGPDITLAKVKNVIGLTVDVNGEVIKLEGDPQQMLQGLINQFVELSGMIVKKTMESILTSYPGMMAMATSGAFGGEIQASTQSSQTSSVGQTVTNASDSVKSEVASAETNKAQVSSENTAVTSVPSSQETMPITAVNPDELDKKQAEGDKSQNGLQPFSSEEMQELNKALEELSKAPLSNDTPPAAQKTSQ